MQLFCIGSVFLLESTFAFWSTHGQGIFNLSLVFGLYLSQFAIKLDSISLSLNLLALDVKQTICPLVDRLVAQSELLLVLL